MSDNSTVDSGFGALQAEDPRDRNYPVRALLAKRPGRRPTSKHWPLFADPLDQGPYGTCVGHAFEHWLMAAPIVKKDAGAEPTALTLYRESCQADEWAENDGGDLTFGTSVRACAKILQRRGNIVEYRWAEAMQDVIDFLLFDGPMVFAMNWHAGMMTPDENGIIYPSGPVLGRHAIIGPGVNTQQGLIYLVNSWGPTWGENGRCKIRISDLETLIFGYGGEACAAIEARV